MTLIFSLLISCFFMALAWQIYLRTHNHIAAEALRPLTIFLVGSSHLFLNGWSEKCNIAICFLIIWGIGHCCLALITQKDDEKLTFFYGSLMQSWEINDTSVLILYLMQGLYAWLLALPFYFIAKQMTYSWVDIVIFLFILVSMAGEFSAKINAYFSEKNTPKTLNQEALWSHCRHPDYFFEWLTWAGFSILGLYNIVSVISLLSCLFLFLMIHLFFIPISEQYLLKRYPKAYADYQKSTPLFIPNPFRLAKIN